MIATGLVPMAEPLYVRIPVPTEEATSSAAVASIREHTLSPRAAIRCYLRR